MPAGSTVTVYGRRMTEEARAPLSLRRWPKLLCFVLLALALDVYFYSGFYMSDDASYLTAIQRIAALEPLDVTDLAHTRLAVVTPAALLYGLTGSIPLTILSYCLYHPIVVLLAYAAGKLCFDERIASYAAALVAVSPTYYFFAGAILPDNCLSAWLGALLVVVLWVGAARQSGELALGRQRLCWGVAGVLTGLAYAAKEPGIVMAVPVGLILLARTWRAGAGHALLSATSYAGGLLSFVALEAMALRLLSGQWVVRLLAGAGSDESAALHEWRLEQQGRLPWERLAFVFEHSSPFYGVGALLLLLVLANIAAPFVLSDRRRSQLWILLAFSGWLFAFLTLGSSRLDRYLPPPIRHARYFAPCLLPALVVAAAMLARGSDWAAQQALAARPRARRIFRALPVVVIACAGALMFVRVEYRAGAAYRAHQTKSALLAFGDARRLFPDLPVVLSPYLSRRLDPLIAEQRGGGVVIRDEETVSRLPQRPFLLLRATPDYDASFGPVLSKLEESGAIQIEPEGEGRYLAPYGRRAELAAALYSLSSELEAPSWPTGNERNAIELFRVSDGRAAPRSDLRR